MVVLLTQVVMRNINLIAQKQPNILQTDVRMFVCKYNDPLYVKLEKIAVMAAAQVLTSPSRPNSIRTR